MSAKVWDITSEGLKTVKVGDHRDKVRSSLGPFRTLQSPYDPERDQFLNHGLQVTYGSDSRTREIMVDIPNQARLRGVDLLGRPVDDVLNDLNVIGVKILRDTDGAILPEEGISLYVVGANVESVTVGYPPIAKA